MISVLLPPILGALAGALTSIAYNWWLTRKEYRSLILSFCAEFVALYERCGMYYDQAVRGEVSYSALFSFTDASAFSKLAAVSKNPEVPTAIIELKAKYFQTQRHVEEASRFALEGSRTSDVKEKRVNMEKASHAQETALAFFLGEHEEIERLTGLLLSAAQRVTPGHALWNLSTRFSNARSKIHHLKTSSAQLQK